MPSITLHMQHLINNLQAVGLMALFIGFEMTCSSKFIRLFEIASAV